MRAFWRATPLEDEECRMLTILAECHAASATRANPSAMAFTNAWLASGDYAKAVASAVLATGGPHAPIRETYELLASPDPRAAMEHYLAGRKRVPGWGNSFHREEPDPLFAPLDEFLTFVYPVEHDLLGRLTIRLQHHLERKIFPNPSAYTALVAKIIEMPADIAPYLFIAGRLATWSGAAHGHRAARPNGSSSTIEPPGARRAPEAVC